MAYVRVNSRHIDAVDYDLPASQLHVQFTDGSEYTYHDVPREVAENVMVSHEPGMTFRRLVKPVYRVSRRS